MRCSKRDSDSLGGAKSSKEFEATFQLGSPACIAKALPEKQNFIKIFCIYLLILTITGIMSSQIAAAGYSWADHRQPFDRTIKVPLFGGTKLAVTLPADFVNNRDTVILNFDIESNFTFRIDGFEQKGFEGFRPRVSVNGGKIFGNYSMSVKKLPARQISKILVKTKYLKAGQNELEFTVGKKGELNYRCRSGSRCIGYFIRKIWFDNFKTATAPPDNVHGSEPCQNPILRLETGMHTAALWALDTDAQNRYLVTGSNDKTVRVWHLSTHKLVRTLRPPIGPGREGSINAVAISPDGETVACGGFTGKSWGNSYCVYLFNRRSGEIIQLLDGFPGSIHDIVYSKDGRFLAIGFFKGVRVYRTPDYKLIGHDPDYDERCSAADFNLKHHLVTAAFDGYIRLYKVSDKGLSRIAARKAPSGSRLFSVKFSAAAKKLAVSYLKDKMSPPTIDVFSSDYLKHLYSPNTTGLDRNLEVIAWSADGRSLYAGGWPFKEGRKHIAPIFKWTEEGLGPRTRLRAARFPIQGICPLKDGGIAFISYDTAWGVIDDQGTRVFIQRPSLANFAGHPKGFPISADAARVLFSYKPRFKIPALFDVESRTLNVHPEPQPDLIFPLTHLPGLDITDWRSSKHPKLNGVELQLQKNETTLCLAIAPDGNSFVLGTEWNLYRFDNKGKLLWKTAVPSVAHSVNISRNSLITIAAIGDGTIRWYRVKDGQQFLTFFPHNDGERWIAWTPEGYYMSSPYADELIGWHINNAKDREAEFYTAMQFERILYRPDCVLDYFHHLGDPKKASTALGKNVFDINKLASIAPPKVKILSDPTPEAVPASKIQLTLAAEKVSLPMRYYTVFVNNIPITAAADRILSGPDRDKFARTVEISPFGPENSIRVEVFNGTSLGLAQTDIYKPVTAILKPKGNIYLVAVGVNDFEHIPDLDYAAFDAESIASFFKKNRGHLFNHAYTKVVSDFSESEPVKINIVASLEFLKQARAQDVVIVFLASHGMSDPAGNYYFVPKDAEPKDLEKLQASGERGTAIASDDIDSLISWESFFEALRSVPGKRLLVVDTCYAKNISGTLDMHSLAKRSATSSFALLAASQKSEHSQEFPQGKQGLFTYGLLKGLTGEGDITGDGKVTLSEIHEFVTEFVENNRNKRLGKQTPHLTAPAELKEMVLSK